METTSLQFANNREREREQTAIINQQNQNNAYWIAQAAGMASSKPTLI